MKKSYKLGIIVPYRNRPKQLSTFRKEINKYIDFDFELIVVDQVDKKDFNRGKLLNIGFIKAEELGCDYVVFHDVDMIPLDADYSYVSKPTHLITKLDLPKGTSRTLFDEYFGGVTAFPTNLFRQINGYSNKYFGWGFEDDDLLLRCLENHIELDSKKVIQKGREGIALDFNGNDSFVVIPNKLSSIRNFSIFVSFRYNNIMSNPSEIADNNSIFSIPGFDTTLTVNSFFDLTFQFWKRDLSSISISEKGLQAGQYNAIITVDNKGTNVDNPDSTIPIVKFYLNGVLVGENKFDKFINIKKQKYIYLGVGDPNREEKNNWFNGKIDIFATYDEALSEEACNQLGSNLSKSLFSLKSSSNLVSYYDMKFVDGVHLLDLKGQQNGRIYNCNQTIIQRTSDIFKPLPFRKKGHFKVLPHKENGYKDGYWVNWTSRENQLRYLKKYYNLKSDYQNDGLTTCKYRIVSSTTAGNYHNIEVKI